MGETLQAVSIKIVCDLINVRMSFGQGNIRSNDHCLWPPKKKKLKTIRQHPRQHPLNIVQKIHTWWFQKAVLLISFLSCDSHVSS